MVVLFLIGIIIVLLHYHARLNEHSEHIKQLQQQIKRLQQQLEQAQSSQIDEYINIKSTHQAIENKNENIKSVPKTEHHLSSEVIFPKAEKTSSTEVIFPKVEPMYQQEQNVIFPKAETVNRSSHTHQSRPSSSPSFVEQVWAWFSTGNPMLKIGVAILFLGLAFLLRFASDYIDTPLWLRYLAVALSGLVATGAGIYLAQKRREYGLILQGFGLAVMYLTTLASLKLPQLIAPSTAFVLMLMVVIGKIVLALRQDAKILAQIALIGGLATPILTSSGSHNYLGLFCYLALLNTGIAMISQFKTWRSLNAMSLLGTFAIAFLWQGRASDVMLADARFISLAFGFYHVVLYGYMVCMYARLQLQQAQPIPSLANQATLSQIYHHYLRFGLQVGVLDASVLFGSALAGFLFLYFTVNDWFAQASMYVSWSFAVIYAGIALFFARTLAKQDDTLSHALWLLVGCFISLGIGLGFDDALAVGLWALQACLVYVFGLKQRVPMARCFALMVLVCSSVLWFDDYQWRIVGDHLLKANRYSTLWLVLAGALVYGLWQSWQGRNQSAEWEIKTQQIALALTLIHAMILPSLWFGILATAWLLIIGLSGLAVWLYRVANTVVAVFVPIATLWTLYYVFLHQTLEYEIKFIFLGLMSSIAILITAFSLHLPSWQNPHKKLSNVYLIAGLFALLMSFFVLCNTFSYQITHTFDLGSQFNFTWTMLFSFAIFAMVFNVVKSLTGRYWHSLACFNLSFMLMMSLILLNLADDHQTTAHIVLLACISLMLSLWILAGQRLSQTKANWVHFIHLGLVLGVASDLFSQSLNANVAYLWGVASLILWACLVYVPFSWKTTFVQAYQQWGQLLCMLLASIWLLDVAISTPMVIGTRLPMLNAMDIIGMLLAIVWYQGIQNKQLAKLKPILMMIGAGLGLIVISSIVMRTWHFYTDIAWNFSSLVADFGVQASLSLVWSAIGISVMVIANKQQARTLWIAGASLVGVVVVKMFLIDLGNSGGIARIVSFIGVGLGLLLVGWFAPVPPKKKEKE